MDTVTLSRAFFGSSLAFHIIFATLGVGLSLMIFISEVLYHWKKDSDYAVMAKRWTKAFAILLGVAIPTGTIVGVQISLLWPGFAKIVGQVISVPFQIEIFAFFLEALFMSIYVYAADKLPPFMRLISLFFVMLGATASAILITSANTWMNTPAGFSMNPDGSVFNVDPWKAFFNPSFFTSSVHVTITAYATGAAVIASIAGFKLLKRNKSVREIAYHKKGLFLGLTVSFITGAILWLSGHESAIALHKHSPEKLAAAEALFDTQSHAPLSLGGVVDPETHELKYGLEFPNMLSMLVGLNPNTVVKGLNDFPQETWPPFYTHTLFNLMVGTAVFAFAVAAISLLYWYFIYRKKGTEFPKWMLWGIAACGPVMMLGIEFGWIFSCSGRQPWTIYGMQRTMDAATRADFVGPLFVLFVILYIGLGALTIFVLRTFFKRHPLQNDLQHQGGGPRA
ncbi:cytochrome ubiquinol oxidase subunit I [Bacillus sp. DX4.1]|uniref:cytochrome ubiquinol oxidase subunit I n=1 Tax=Bacillus sp. DX4.1 TaxID=3055867 RepID=UPI0025A2BBD6|nr:cytochrome ubiquinol oxidase subunit I [Bacillus sp. DX4.1]MDM5190805.1 cytochrome ubiquinol oxidase subunit I [Bacillus sp. DX4.1]